MKKQASQVKADVGKGGSHSAFEAVPPDKVGLFDRLKLGSHKQTAGWGKRLKAAGNEWRSEAHDRVIGKPHLVVDAIHPSEVEAAARWECFRHLFFSGKLSRFWDALVRGNQFEATDPLENSPSIISFVTGVGANDFGAPWAVWADDPCFPAQAWIAARKKAHFKFGLRAAPKPHKHAVVLNDSWQSWKEIYTHAQGELNAIINAANQQALHSDGVRRSVTPLRMPLTRLPIEDGSENISRIVVEIDWSSTKGEIIKDFESGILPIWKDIQDAIKQGKKKTGRRDGPLAFFAGLVIRRRLDRGLSGADAVKEHYKPLRDRKLGMSKRAKLALKMADERLSQIATELEGIEKKMRDEANDG